MPPANESLLHDARAAGVHSAAALFRRTSEKTNRKYTRPPMSKLFMSLQLTPENFLLMQAQAKSYMLDTAHPDRQSCVGNRGKGDTDMVKLRLFNCVRDFLSGGAGQQFFGENVDKPGENDAVEAARALGEEKAPTEDRLLWPRDGNKIISLVTPLLRRMVTNERQRMYAIESRKGGAKKKEASVEAAPTPGNNTQGMNEPHGLEQQVERLQTLDLPPHLHALAPIQPQHQHLYPTSPELSLSGHSPAIAQSVTPEPVMHTYRQSGTRYRLDLTQKLELPKEPPAEAILEHVNLFVTKVMPAWRGNKTPEPALLRVETRLENSDEAPLFHMSWEELCQQVEMLLKNAVCLYPELEPKESLLPELKSSDTVYTYHGLQSEPQLPQKQKQKPVVPLLPGMGPEALRGLAVAATEIQDGESAEIANNGFVAPQEQNPFADPPTAPASAVPSPTSHPPSAPSPTAGSSANAPTPAPSPSALSPTSQKRVSFVEPLPRRSPTPSSDSSEGPTIIEGPDPQPLQQTGQQKTPRGMQRPSQVLAPSCLPKYEIETLWTRGARAITCREDWHMVKVDVACAIWTDKVLNVVVKIL